MKVKYSFSFLAVLFVGTVPGQAVSFTYTSEEDYLEAISSYTSVTEDFESGFSTSGVASTSSQGITWTASGNVKVNTYWALGRSPLAAYDDFGDPDQLFGTNSIGTLYGVGGWFRTQNGTASSISVLFDGSSVGSFGLNDTFSFFGAIETSGFSSFSLITSSGHWAVDDITFARGVPDTGSTSVPDTGSTAALLGVGVAALAFARRRLG